MIYEHIIKKNKKLYKNYTPSRIELKYYLLDFMSNVQIGGRAFFIQHISHSVAFSSNNIFFVNRNSTEQHFNNI